MITEKQGYEAMMHMLYSYWKLTGSEDLTDILGGGGYLADGEPFDSTFYGYWEEAIEKVKNGDVPFMLKIEK
jgi:hypothetical protein